MSRTAVAELAVQVGMWAQTQDFDEEQWGFIYSEWKTQ